LVVNLAPTQFQSTLLPASYAGIPFQVTEDVVRTGQRVAEHTYPYRDTPYSEPMGRAARQYSFTAFLVGEGGVLQAQLYALLAAIETDGPGILVHPLLGAINVIPLQNCEVQQNTAGRYVELRLTFVEAGSILTPSSNVDTQANTLNAAAAGSTQSQAQFNSDTSNAALPSGSTMTPTTSPSAAAGSYNEAGNAAVAADNTGFDVEEA
jgi:prophage DNA circulation protein